MLGDKSFDMRAAMNIHGSSIYVDLGRWFTDIEIENQISRSVSDVFWRKLRSQPSNSRSGILWKS